MEKDCKEANMETECKWRGRGIGLGKGTTMLKPLPGGRGPIRFRGYSDKCNESYVKTGV